MMYLFAFYTCENGHITVSTYACTKLSADLPKLFDNSQIIAIDKRHHLNGAAFYYAAFARSVGYRDDTGHL